MNKKVLIVEDQFVEANDIQLILAKAGYDVCGIARSVPVAQEIIKKERPELVLLDIYLKGKQTGIDLAMQLKEDNIAFIYLSANSNEEILSVAKTTEPYGFIVKPFREKDLLVTLEIAQYRHEHSRQLKYGKEAELIQQLDRKLAGITSWNDLLLEMGKILGQEIPFDYLAIGFDDLQRIPRIAISFLRIGLEEYQVIGVEELSNITGVGKKELLEILAVPGKEKVAVFYNGDEFEKKSRVPSHEKLAAETFQVKSLLSFPLLLEGGTILSFDFYSRIPDAYHSGYIGLLQRLQETIRNRLAHVAHIKTEGQHLSNTPAVNNAQDYTGIIGNSPLLLKVMEMVAQVAPFDTSVLILGESGTGKERVADCIHHMSPRKGKPFIKVNCAALPATLIESELFGHEKGAFTGASDKRVGKFQQANGGTIFLDEIGEMPLDLQVKLLRVLQEQEIEPIGGKSPVKIDVRVIAATNKNLEKEVANGRFRLDIYYRLNVVPIELPPLRERMEDIPLLVQFFIELYNRKSGKRITGVSEKALKNMLAYSWPGNIRELEHLIERGVLLAKGPVIDDLSLPDSYKEAASVKTIHENERDHIISILKKCNGKVWGPGGAAEVLNIPPSTLKSKMKKLGISRI